MSIRLGWSGWRERIEALAESGPDDVLAESPAAKIYSRHGVIR